MLGPCVKCMLAFLKKLSNRFPKQLPHLTAPPAAREGLAGAPCPRQPLLRGDGLRCAAVDEELPRALYFMAQYPIALMCPTRANWVPRTEL